MKYISKLNQAMLNNFQNQMKFHFMGTNYIKKYKNLEALNFHTYFDNLPFIFNTRFTCIAEVFTSNFLKIAKASSYN